MTDQERTIGRLEAHVDDLREEVRALRQDIGDLKALVEQGRGVRWVLTALAGVTGAAGGVVSSAAGLFRGH